MLYTAWRCFRVAFVLALVSFICYRILQRHLLSIKFQWIMAYFRKRKLSFMTDLFSWKIMTCIYLAKILNNSLPTHLNQIFGKREDPSYVQVSSLGQKLIIPKWRTFVLLLYGHVTIFPPKLTSLCENTSTSEPNWRRWGQHVCNEIQSIWVIGIILYLPIRVSQILMKENNEFINIFQTWPILSQAK